ncbi:MAG: hypothetical protein AAF518_06070 [Spirochaetota bacterium]
MSENGLEGDIEKVEEENDRLLEELMGRFTQAERDKLESFKNLRESDYSSIEDLQELLNYIQAWDFFGVEFVLRLVNGDRKVLYFDNPKAAKNWLDRRLPGTRERGL